MFGSFKRIIGERGAFFSICFSSGIKSVEKINVQLENDILTVHAEKGCCCKDKEVKEKLIRHERHYEAFEESVKLPVSVDPKKTEAHYQHGILTVKMAKSAPAKDNVHIVKVN